MFGECSNELEDISNTHKPITELGNDKPSPTRAATTRGRRRRKFLKIMWTVLVLS